MGKHVDAVKSYEEFRAPWETEGGEDADIVKSTLKRWIYNLIKDKAKAQDAREEALEAVKTAETERDEAKAEAAKANPDEVNKKLAKLEKERDELKAENESLTKDKELSELRSEVLAGLDPKYAKYVTGEDRDALEKSLEQVKADFDLGDEENEGEEDEIPARTRPRSRLQNPADGKSGKGGDNYDYDKVAEGIIGGGPFVSA